jgi:aromatic ring-cleaving dioxygenase
MTNSTADVAELAVSASADAEQLRAQIVGEGFGVTDVEAKNNNADKYVTLYHAYNGKVRSRIPFYMVDTREGTSLLFRTFTADDIKNDNADPKWVGQRVWHIKPQPTEDIVGKFNCPFSADADEATKAEMNERGFRCDCRKAVTFATRDEADRHVEKRHPRRYRILKEQIEKEEQRARDDSLATVLNALKEQMAPKRASKAAE